MIDTERDLAWFKAATQRWDAKPRPLLEDGTNVWTKSMTLPSSRSTYCMYAFLSTVSNLCWASFHNIFGASGAASPAPGVVAVAISPSFPVSTKQRPKCLPKSGPEVRNRESNEFLIGQVQSSSTSWNKII